MDPAEKIITKKFVTHLEWDGGRFGSLCFRFSRCFCTGKRKKKHLNLSFNLLKMKGLILKKKFKKPYPLRSFAQTLRTADFLFTEVGCAGTGETKQTQQI